MHHRLGPVFDDRGGFERLPSPLPTRHGSQELGSRQTYGSTVARWHLDKTYYDLRRAAHDLHTAVQLYSSAFKSASPTAAVRWLGGSLAALASHRAPRM